MHFVKSSQICLKFSLTPSLSPDGGEGKGEGLHDGLVRTDLEGSMKCPHCNNSMIYEKFYGPDEYFWGWRCLFCGEIVDDTILENRSLQVGARRTFKK